MPISMSPASKWQLWHLSPLLIGAEFLIPSYSNVIHIPGTPHGTVAVARPFLVYDVVLKSPAVNVTRAPDTGIVWSNRVKLRLTIFGRVTFVDSWGAGRGRDIGVGVTISWGAGVGIGVDSGYGNGVATGVGENFGVGEEKGERVGATEGDGRGDSSGGRSLAVSFLCSDRTNHKIKIAVSTTVAA